MARLAAALALVAASAADNGLVLQTQSRSFIADFNGNSGGFKLYLAVRVVHAWLPPAAAAARWVQFGGAPTCGPRALRHNPRENDAFPAPNPRPLTPQGNTSNTFYNIQYQSIEEVAANGNTVATANINLALAAVRATAACT